MFSLFSVLHVSGSCRTPTTQTYLVECILNASCLVDVLDEVLDEYEPTPYFAEDGSTNLPYIIEAARWVVLRVFYFRPMSDSKYTGTRIV